MDRKEEAQQLIANLVNKNYTHSDIASKIGVSERTIIRWAQKNHNPHRTFLKALKRLLLIGE